MKKLIRYVMADILRNKVLLGYTALLLVISVSVFRLEDNPAKGVLSMLNVVLHLVPLFSIIFSAIYMYNGSEFIELLVSQPIRRIVIWRSFFGGLALSFCVAFMAGAGIPLLLFAPWKTAVLMVFMGLGLSVVFVSMAMLCAARVRDKARGIGLVVITWLFFTVVYDGMLLFILFQFSDYPLEELMIALGVLNPVDLARILVLLELDISAMMGYTGALFREFFGTGTGMAVSALALLLWAAIPVWWSGRIFSRKDL